MADEEKFSPPVVEENEDDASLLVESPPPDNGNLRMPSLVGSPRPSWQGFSSGSFTSDSVQEELTPDRANVEREPDIVMTDSEGEEGDRESEEDVAKEASGLVQAEVTSSQDFLTQLKALLEEDSEKDTSATSASPELGKGDFLSQIGAIFGVDPYEFVSPIKRAEYSSISLESDESGSKAFADGCVFQLLQDFDIERHSCEGVKMQQIMELTFMIYMMVVDHIVPKLDRNLKNLIFNSYFHLFYIL